MPRVKWVWVYPEFFSIRGIPFPDLFIFWILGFWGHPG
jgi:hypothetical protein